MFLSIPEPHMTAIAILKLAFVDETPLRKEAIKNPIENIRLDLTSVDPELLVVSLMVKASGCVVIPRGIACRDIERNVKAP